MADGAKKMVYAALAGIRDLIRRTPEVERVSEILTMHMGPDYILVNISLHISRHSDRTRVHALFSSVDRCIKEKYPSVRRGFIESETALAPAVTPENAAAPH